MANASEVVIWGSGQPKREFLYVDDMAAASVFVMGLTPEAYGAEVHPQLSHINVGFGTDVTIAELAHLIAEVVEYSGRLVFDVTKPDGAPRKLMNSGRLKKLGWQPQVQLREGLVCAYEAMQAI